MAGRSPETTDEAILALFVLADGHQLTTTDVREALGYTQSGTYRRLRSLVEDGHLEGRSVGNNTLWKLSDEFEMAYLYGE